MRLAAAAILLVAPAAVASPPTQPITNRSYELDLYEGFALGSTEIVAMGGAGVANAIGSSGTLINPSAPAVRQTTDQGWWSWDYHLDYLDGSLSNDYDNAQLGGTTAAARVLTLGLSGRLHDWAAAITGTAQYEDLPGNLRPEELHLRFAVARWIPQLDLAVGGDVSVGQFNLIDTMSTPNQTLFTISGTGFEAGAQWLPSMQDVRLGASVATSEHGNNVTVSGCDPESCTEAGFILPEEVFVPWRLAAGVAYRWADTRWNQIVRMPFRDEHAVTVVADLVVTGAAPNGYGIEAFGAKQLERSGRNAAWSPRGGVEYEWLPGRLRVRGGSYWEPGRFDGVDGRLHVTFGVELRVFQFYAWGLRRGAITLTTDAAHSYQNAGLSIGFWH